MRGDSVLNFNIIMHYPIPELAYFRRSALLIINAYNSNVIVNSTFWY